MHSTQRFLIRAGTCIGALLVTAGCETNPITGRQQLMIVSEGEAQSASAQAYAKTVGAAQIQRKLDTNAARTNRVKAITQRLIAPATSIVPASAQWSWQVHVIDDDSVNAWCMPGGKIAVYTGLIERLQANDDELAAVMGHEIAHALREHGRERASAAAGQGIAIGVLATVAGAPAGTADLSKLILDYTFNLPNSRTHETEADRIGVELAARAGFDPRASITLWQKMQQASGGGPPQFMSTHPSHQTRISDLQVYAARVMPLYEQARRR